MTDCLVHPTCIVLLLHPCHAAFRRDNCRPLDGQACFFGVHSSALQFWTVVCFHPRRRCHVKPAHVSVAPRVRAPVSFTVDGAQRPLPRTAGPRPAYSADLAGGMVHIRRLVFVCICIDPFHHISALFPKFFKI